MQEKTDAKGKGIRVRYDMPTSYARTSLLVGGFANVQRAIAGPLGQTMSNMTNPPSVGWRQPPDDVKYLMNSLDLWL